MGRIFVFCNAYRLITKQPIQYSHSQIHTKETIQIYENILQVKKEISTWA